MLNYHGKLIQHSTFIIHHLALSIEHFRMQPPSRSPVLTHVRAPIDSTCDRSVRFSSGL